MDRSIRNLINLVENAGNDVDAGLIKAAIEHFGLTTNINEIGYILPEGQPLDLSGRHQQQSDYKREGNRWVKRRKDQPDWAEGRRDTDHRDLDDLVEGGGTAGMLEFMQRTGAVRVFANTGFTVVRYPSDRQIGLMARIGLVYALRNGPIQLECDGMDGRTKAHIELDRPTEAEIRAFLAGVSF